MPDSPRSSLVIFVLIKPPPTARALEGHASRARVCGEVGGRETPGMPG
jgi:hypothetical protein